MSDPASTTIPEILAEIGARNASAPALRGIGDGTVMTYAQLAGIVRTVGERLALSGVGQGDVVMLAVADGPAALIGLLSAASVATVLPVPAQDQRSEYERLIGEVPVRAIAMDDRPDATLSRIAAERGLPLVRLIPARNGDAALLGVEVDRPATPRPPVPPTPSDIAVIGLTSGTTAAPKLVAVSHASAIASARRFAELMGLTAADRSLCMMPIAHLHSLLRSSLPVLLHGGEVIWAPGLDPRRALEWLDEHRPTFISGTPTHFRKIADQAEAAGWRPTPGSPRLIALGSDKVGAEDMRRAGSVFGAAVAQFYGMTETSPSIATTPIGINSAPDPTAMRINPDWQVVCLDTAGVPVSAGEVGEIAVRGGFINPIVGPTAADRTRLDAEGRFLTGDLGRKDEAGYLYVVGRIDDRITRGGEKIAPQAIESVISSMAGVAAAVVFGAPDPVFGERVIAVVEPRSPGSIDDTAVLQHAARHLKSHMVPERVIVVDRIPDTRVGKVSRRALADLFAAGLRSAGTGDARQPTPAPGPRLRPDGPPPGSPLDTAAADLSADVLEILRRRLEQPGLAPDADFYQAGGDSLTALEVLMEIESRFGVSLAPAAFTVAGTSARLALAIQEARGHPAGARLIEAQAGRGGTVLVVSHGLGGEAGYAPNLARAMDASQTVAALHARPAGDQRPAPRTLPEMAEGYAAIIRDHYPGATCVVGGFSLGAHVSLAVANRLVEKQADAPLVVVLDDEADLDKRNFGARKQPPEENSPEALNRWALAASPAAPYPGRILYFRADENAATYRSDPTAGWGEVALAGVEIVDVPGSHHVVVRKDWLKAIGARIQQEIDRLPTTSRGTLPRPDEGRRLRLAAREAAREGDLDAEIAHMRAALEVDRDQPYWLFGNLAEALFRSGRHRDAMSALREAVERDPWPLTTDLRFVRLLAASGFRNQIGLALDRAGTVVRDHPSVCAQLAELFAEAGRIGDAEKAYREGLSGAPRHLKLNFGWADLLFLRERFEEASRVFATIREDYPEIQLAHLRLGNALIRAGQPHRAASVLSEALDRWPRSARLALLQARALRLAGDRRGAEDACRKAISLAPQADAPRHLLDELLEEAGGAK